MHGRGVLVLGLLVGGLVAAAVLTKDDAVAGPEGGGGARVLFDGVSTDRVRALRVENLERSVVVQMERDDSGIWSLTDPLAYPAEAGSVKALLDVVSTLRGEPLAGVDPAALGLDPPVATVRVVEEVGGAERRTEVAVGHPDIDPNSCFYLVDGEVLRAPRSLHVLVDRDADTYRTQRVLSVAARNVIAIERSGAFPLQEEPLEDRGWAAPDATLVAEQVADGWRLSEPYKATLDPIIVQQLLAATTMMPVRGFASDDPDAGPAYGLDEPALVVTLRTTAGDRQVIRFAQSDEDAESPPDERRWYASIDGLPHVWEVDYRAPWIAATAAEILVETQVVRALRGEVTRLVIRAPGGEVRLTRPGTRWLLERDGTTLPADPGRVDDLLSILEQAQVARPLPGVLLSEPAGSFELETRRGRIQAGTIGQAHTTPDGATGVLYRRDGDELCGLVDVRLAELLAAASADLRDRQVVEVPEAEAIRVSVTAPDGRARTWEKDSHGLWCVEGALGIEDRDFALVVDRVLSVRVDGWLEGADPLTGAYSVAVTHHVEGEHVFRVGEQAGEERVELGGDLGSLRPGLLAALAGLFE